MVARVFPGTRDHDHDSGLERLERCLAGSVEPTKSLTTCAPAGSHRTHHVGCYEEIGYGWTALRSTCRRDSEASTGCWRRCTMMDRLARWRQAFTTTGCPGR